VRYRAVGFDLLTALLDTWTLWSDVAGSRELGMKWHATSQGIMRGTPYRPYKDIVREAAAAIDLPPAKADELLRRWGDFAPWPDVALTLRRIQGIPRFIVTNCSRTLGRRAAERLGAFDLVMTAEEAGAYKPDPRPYRAALATLRLAPREVLFVAGSAHDVGGASRVGMDVYWANRGDVPLPPDARPLRAERGLNGLLATLGV